MERHFSEIIDSISKFDFVSLFQIRANFRQDGRAPGSSQEWGGSLMLTCILSRIRAGETDDYEHNGDDDDDDDDRLSQLAACPH